MSPEFKKVFQFGPFRLDTEQHLLLRDGEIVPLTRKAFDTLSLLVENSGRVLQKEEMMKSIWPDSFVEEATLAQNVFTLRKVLGESPTGPHYIETVPKRGYRFIAKVSEASRSEGGQVIGGRADGNLNDRALAVVPFKTLSADENEEYFGLGMADALITRLSNIKEILVRPTSAVLKYNRQDHDIFNAGRELKVPLVVDGIIQRLGDRIRVTVQLVNIENGAPLWAHKFDEKFNDVFAIQDIISEKIAEALTLELTSAQKLLLTKSHTKNSEAYRNYLKGCYHWSKWTEEGFRKSIDFFERATEIEPDYALPYAGLATTYASLGFYSYLRPYEAMPQVKAMAKRALELDDQLAEARLAQATALFFYDWDWAGAEDEFKRSIKANPGYAVAHQTYGLYLMAMKRFNEASLCLKRALESDPVSPLIKMTAGLPYYYAGEYEKAIKYFLEALETEPYFGIARIALGEVYVQQGLYEESFREYKKVIDAGGERLVLPYLGYAYAVSNKRNKALSALKKLEQLSAHEYVSLFSWAIIYTGLGQKDDAFKWLEKAYQERSNRLVFLNVLPIFNTLRSDRRFINLLQRMGLQP
jgi:serine/threonine-protein kinase